MLGTSTHAEVDAPRLLPLSTRFSCRATQQHLAECGVEQRLAAASHARSTNQGLLHHRAGLDLTYVASRASCNAHASRSSSGVSCHACLDGAQHKAIARAIAAATAPSAKGANRIPTAAARSNRKACVRRPMAWEA